MVFIFNKHLVLAVSLLQSLATLNDTGILNWQNFFHEESRNGVHNSVIGIFYEFLAMIFICTSWQNYNWL